MIYFFVVRVCAHVWRESHDTTTADVRPHALVSRGGRADLSVRQLHVDADVHVANSPRSKHDDTGETPQVTALGIGSGGMRWLLAVQAVCGWQRRSKRRRGTAPHTHISLKLRAGQVVSSVWPGLACVLVGLRALAVARVVDEHDESERNRAWAVQSGASGAGRAWGTARMVRGGGAR